MTCRIFVPFDGSRCRNEKLERWLREESAQILEKAAAALSGASVRSAPGSATG